MAVKQGRFYLRHNTLSEDIPIVIIFKVRLQVSTDIIKNFFVFKFLFFSITVDIQCSVNFSIVVSMYTTHRAIPW